MSERRGPFKGDMIPFSAKKGSDIYEITSNPKKLIRKRQITPDDSDNLSGRNFSVEEFKVGRKLFAELESRYDIRVVASELVLGNDASDEKNMYMVVDSIQGKNLKNTEYIPKESLEEADNVYASLLQYYYDKLDTEEEYLTDIESFEQIVYGRKSDEEKRHFYVVDVDPVFNFHETPDNLVETISSIISLIKELEGKFDKGFYLKKSRELALEILESIGNETMNEASAQTLQRLKVTLIQYNK